MRHHAKNIQEWSARTLAAHKKYIILGWCPHQSFRFTRIRLLWTKNLCFLSGGEDANHGQISIRSERIVLCAECRVLRTLSVDGILMQRCVFNLPKGYSTIASCLIPKSFYHACTIFKMDSKIKRPSVFPKTLSDALSGCGIMPKTLRCLLHIPAI